VILSKSGTQNPKLGHVVDRGRQDSARQVAARVWPYYGAGNAAMLGAAAPVL